jgi:hypothetical protein
VDVAARVVVAEDAAAVAAVLPPRRSPYWTWPAARCGG